MKLHLPGILREAILKCFAFVVACTLYSGNLGTAANLTLGNTDSLSVDYAKSNNITNLNDGILTFDGDTALLLTNLGKGDGKTYTLLTGISALQDTEGNVISLDSTNNAIANYFDTSRPGTGFWADGTLQFVDGKLQLVLHSENVITSAGADGVTHITSRQIDGSTYQYYKWLSISNIEHSSSSPAYGGAIGGHSATILSNNGSVVFEGNSISSSTTSRAAYAYGGAIFAEGSKSITLNNNGSVEFNGNSACATTTSSYSTFGLGGAIYGEALISLNNNGSVVFKGNSASATTSTIGSGTPGYGGAIYGSENSEITLNNNGSVLFEGNSASTYYYYSTGGAIHGDVSSSISLCNNGIVIFRKNSASGTAYVYGGAICVAGGSIILNDNDIVYFDDNSADSGGALCGYYGTQSTIILRNNGEVIFDNNKASSTNGGGAICQTMEGSSLTLSDNGSVTFSNNRNIATNLLMGGSAIQARDINITNNTSVNFTGNFANGADVMGGALSGSGDVVLSNNRSLSFFDNMIYAIRYSSSSAYGGALYGHTLTLSNNDDIIFSGNAAISTSFAHGAAIYAWASDGGNFAIQNNKSVIFENNYTISGENLLMEGVYASDRETGFMNISFSAPSEGRIEFRDTIKIDLSKNTLSSFKLNSKYTDNNNNSIAQIGDIIFTGAYITDGLVKRILYDHDLMWMTSAQLSEFVNKLKTSEVNGTMQLLDGRLILRDGAVMATNGIKVLSSVSKESTPTLWLHHGGLTSYQDSADVKNTLAFASGTAFMLSGQNMARNTTITFSDGSAWIITLDSSHENTAALSLINSSLTLPSHGTVVLELRAENLTPGKSYALLSGISKPTGWDDTTITVLSGTSGWDIGWNDLTWVDDILWLYHTSLPELETATWTNESADSKWNTTSVNWAQDDFDCVYKDGVAVVFSDEGTGCVTLVGHIAPKSVLVDSAGEYTWVADTTEGGSLTGSMKLTKQGEGKLTIQTSNSYTGGTAINAGVLVAGHANALGTGTVMLAGGTLEIGATGITNTITNSGTSTLRIVEGITHILTGPIDNSGELTFSGEFQASGLGSLIIRVAATYENVAGNIDSTGGFCKSAIEGIQLTTGTGTTANNHATIWHGTNELILGSDSWATAGGDVSYGSYYIGTDHKVKLDDIIDAAANKGINTTNISLSGGKLTANTELTGTLSISGTSTLHGVDFDLGNAPLQNSGDLVLTGSFIADGLNKTKTWNSYVTVDNEVSSNGSGFLREGDFSVLVAKGTVTSSNATVEYHGQPLTMAGGIGSGVGEVQYDIYRILGGHTASSSSIHSHDAGKGQNALITLESGGTLNADNAATETKVSTTGGIINLSAGTLNGTVGGSTTVVISGTATMSGDNSYTGDTTLNGADLTVTHAHALGTGAICSTGESSLSVVGVELALNSAISNSGTLTLIGNFDASALNKSATADVYVDAMGNETAYGSGFTRSGDFTVTIANGTVDSNGAIVSYKGTTLEMTGGIGLSKGGMLWSDYRILEGHAVELSAIVNKAAENQVSTTNIHLNGGKLTANTELTGPLSISGTSTLHGVDFDLGNAPLQNSGDLALTGCFIADGLSKTKTWNSYVTVDNEVSSNGSGFLREGDFEVTIANGTVDSTSATVKYGAQTLTMNGGVGSGIGTLNYGNYRILSGHTASSSAIHGYDNGAGRNTHISLFDGGTLNADDANTVTWVNSTGGCINLSAGTLNGTIGGSTTVCVIGTGTIYGNNSYTGGTTIEGGRLEIGHANALGTGSVTLNGGTLDLNSYAVGNDIFATGGTLEGGDNFGGKLTVNGDLTLGGETTAGGGILLQGGSISGGSIVDTDITVEGPGDMEISSDIRGNSSLTLNNGNLTVRGNNNDYTGGTTINNGNLIIGSGSSLGTGDITLNGGTLNTNGQEISNNIVNNGGTLISSYVLSKGNTLTVGKGGMSMAGNLTLAGGNLHFKGMPLTVDGKVTSTAPIDVLVCGYSVIDEDDTVQLADFGDNTIGVTTASFNNIGYGSFNYDEATSTLSITLTNKNIWVGGKGMNWVQGLNVGWQNYETFEAGNRVVFNTKGTVKIEGGVEPASVLVDIEKSLSFSTKYNKKVGLYSGAIVGNGCIVKRGSGKLTMNDGNTYSGGTFIEAGTVNAKGVSSFGTGAITLSGGTLNLASKAVANDITLNGAVAIKSGKKFLGTYTQDGGELMKASVLNISESATISGGVVNGTLCGVGTVTIDGDVELGTTGKITTDKLLVNGSLSASTKGLAMNTKTSDIDINGGMLTSMGKISAASLKLNGGSLRLSGALSVKDLTLGSGTLTLDGAKLATVKVGNSLMLEGDTTLNFGFSVKEKDEGKSFNVFSFKTISSSITDAMLNELLGLGTDAATLAFDSKRKAITLTVTDADAWNEYAESVRNGTWTATPSEDDVLTESAGAFVLARPTAGVDPMLGKVADTLVQSTWGTAGASRAFGDTIAARGTHATALADGKAAAWISTMGGSSRLSSDGGHAGADYTLTGAAFGMETRLSETSTVGLAIGNSWGKVSTFSAFPVDQDSTHQGIYGKHLLGSSTTLSWMAAHTRTESDGNLAGMACDWTQDALQLDARVDKLFAISDRTTVSAFVGMQYLATDKGECNGLSTGSLQNLRGEIGVSATHKVTDRTYVYGELSFIGDMLRNNPTGTVGDYRSRGANPGRAGLNLSVGASYQLNDSWSLNGSYGLELMQNQTSHSANVGATYSF